MLFLYRDECADPARLKDADKNGLDREAFARGMWRIDEELRRVQLGIVNVHRGGRSTARR
jgi:hypothetical protein